MDSDAQTHDVWVDPVSHEAVDPGQPRYESFYAGLHYHFINIVNKQTFDSDPQLWISTPHASETSASLSPTGEPQ